MSDPNFFWFQKFNIILAVFTILTIGVYTVFYQQEVDILSEIISEDECNTSLVPDVNDWEELQIISKESQYLWKEERWEEAMKIAKRQNNVCLGDKYYGTNSNQYAIFLNNLSQTYGKLKQYDIAIQLLTKSLLISEDLVQKDEKQILLHYNNLGQLYKLIDQPDQALNIFMEIKRSFQKVFGLYHINTAILYNNIAGAYLKQGDLTKAMLNCRKSINVFNQSKDFQSIYYYLALNQEALIHYYEGNLAYSEDLFKKSLDKQIQYLKGDHPILLKTRNNLCNINNQYCDQEIQVDENYYSYHTDI